MRYLNLAPQPATPIVRSGDPRDFYLALDHSFRKELKVPDYELV
jgi:hypothetical protein